jgi:hypothetical protein
MKDNSDSFPVRTVNWKSILTYSVSLQQSNKAPKRLMTDACRICRYHGNVGISRIEGSKRIKTYPFQCSRQCYKSSYF